MDFYVTVQRSLQELSGKSGIRQKRHSQSCNLLGCVN